MEIEDKCFGVHFAFGEFKDVVLHIWFKEKVEKFVLLRFRGLFSLAKFSELSRRRGDKRSSFFIHHLRKDFTQHRQTFRLLVAIN